MARSGSARTYSQGQLLRAKRTSLPAAPALENSSQMWSAPQVTASNVERSTSSVFANHVAAAYTGFMRNPFRKAPMQQLETTIVSLAKRGEQLVAKRVSAQETLDKTIQARRDTLLSADLEDHRGLDKQQAAVVAATSDLAGIDDALAVLAHRKAEAERQLAAERERIKRAAAADKLANQVAAIEVALPGYLEQSRALADALSEIGHFHFESGQMAGFLHNTMGQIEVAANFTLAELKAMPGAIREGRQTIPGEPVRTPVEVTEPKQKMQTASQGVTGKSVPHIEPDPVMRAANFTVIDRSAEARTIQIEVPQT
jgi:hypothetical protein